MRRCLIAVTLTLAGCATNALTPLRADTSALITKGGEAARQGVAAQVAAWNRGDIDAALAAYWDSPRMTWVSKSGIEYGYSSFEDAMRKDFADPTSMGIFSTEILDARDLGSGTNLIVYRWKIVRGEKRLMGGLSTQIWRRLDGNWRIVLEHAS